MNYFLMTISMFISIFTWVIASHFKTWSGRWFLYLYLSALYAAVFADLASNMMKGNQ